MFLPPWAKITSFKPLSGGHSRRRNTSAMQNSFHTAGVTYLQSSAWVFIRTLGCRAADSSFCLGHGTFVRARGLCPLRRKGHRGAGPKNEWLEPGPPCWGSPCCSFTKTSFSFFGYAYSLWDLNSLTRDQTFTWLMAVQLFHFLKPQAFRGIWATLSFTSASKQSLNSIHLLYSLQSAPSSPFPSPLTEHRPSSFSSKTIAVLWLIVSLLTTTWNKSLIWLIPLPLAGKSLPWWTEFTSHSRCGACFIPAPPASKQLKR